MFYVCVCVGGAEGVFARAAKQARTATDNYDDARTAPWGYHIHCLHRK